MRRHGDRREHEHLADDGYTPGCPLSMMAKLMHRRQFMQVTAGAVGAAALAGLPRVAHAQRKINVIGGAESLWDGIMAEFKNRTEIAAEATIVNHPTLNNRMLAGGTKIYDTAESCTNFLQPLWDAGAFQPVPVEKVMYYDQMRDMFKDENAFGVDKFSKWPAAAVWADAEKTKFKFVPQLFNGDSVAYNPEKVDPAPTSWGALYDEKFAGRVGIWNDPSFGVTKVALYLHKNGMMDTPKSGTHAILNQEEVDFVVDWLIQKKKGGQFRTLWDSWPQILDLHTSGEVWISDAWQPAVEEVKRRGAPCKYAVVQEGFDGWSHCIGISVDTKDMEAALEYINFWGEGWPGAQITAVGYYSAFTTVEKYMSKEDYGKWYGGVGRDEGSFEDKVGNMAHWVLWPPEMPYYYKRWKDFEAA